MFGDVAAFRPCLITAFHRHWFRVTNTLKIQLLAVCKSKKNFGLQPCVIENVLTWYCTGNRKWLSMESARPFLFEAIRDQKHSDGLALLY